MLKNLLLINAALRILFLSETQPGSVHDKRMADTTPYPLPPGSQLLQDMGFQAFTLEGVDIIQPTKKPRGQELTPEQKADNREIARRRVRIEHVNSSENTLFKEKNRGLKPTDYNIRRVNRISRKVLVSKRKTMRDTVSIYN